MASSTLALAQVASKITTIGQVRAAMGAVTLTLSKGYAKLDDISTIAGEQEAARHLLDVVNKSAATLYHIYNDDPDLQDEEISTWHATIAGKIIAEANDALKAVEAAANESLWDVASIVDAALANVGGAVGATLQGVTNAVAAGAAAAWWAAWPTFLIIGAAGVAYVYRRRILAAIAKSAGG